MQAVTSDIPDAMRQIATWMARLQADSYRRIWSQCAVSTPDPEPPPDDDEPEVALEPSTEAEHPMRAEDCLALLAKEIGLWLTFRRSCKSW